MKRISVRRKKKAPPPEPKPEPVPEPQKEEVEVEFSESESIAETEPPEQEFRNLDLDDRQRMRPKVHFEPPDDEPRSTAFARPRTNPVGIRDRPGYIPNRRTNFIHDPRSNPYANPSRRKKPMRNLQYRSPYGAGTWNLSTQDKARLLYSSCFG